MRLTLLPTLLFLAAVPATAATITQTISEPYPEPENFGGIALFDPTLGQLTAVTQTVAGNLVFAPASGSSYYAIYTGPLLSPVTENASATIDVSATISDPAALAGFIDLASSFGPHYVIEAFDTTVVNGGTLSSLGPVTDSFTYTYTPVTAATPEPASLALLSSGFVALTAGVRRRRSRSGTPRGA